MDWGAIERDISTATGKTFRAEQVNRLGGGCINEATCLEGGGRRYFVKVNTPQRLDMFAAEAEGLRELLASDSIRAPKPVTYGSNAARSWLVLEHIEFGPASTVTSRLLGEQLAAMHRHHGEHYGWERDNTIGSTPQVNTPGRDWVDFLRENRLRYQLELAGANGASSSLMDRGSLLLDALPAFFETYNPAPSLLHGDLWGGNWAADSAGQPIIFDPAVYYGDRETDLAMTELFGGFDDRFYQSYRHAWAIDPGYSSRKVLYNLYHVLNHFNLFRGSYAGQALGMVDTLLAQVR